MKLTNDDFKNNVRVVDRGLVVDTVQYWYIIYRCVTWSVYFDYDDSLGSYRGQPYFELWDGEDTSRFTKKKYLNECVVEMCKLHDKELQEFPERFL